MALGYLCTVLLAGGEGNCLVPILAVLLITSPRDQLFILTTNTSDFLYFSITILGKVAPLSILQALKIAQVTENTSRILEMEQMGLCIGRWQSAQCCRVQSQAFDPTHCQQKRLIQSKAGYRFPGRRPEVVQIHGISRWLVPCLCL